MDQGTLIQQVIGKKEEGESWDIFAARIGCKANHLYRLRTGARRPSVAWLRGVLQEFPDLHPTVSQYLAEGNGAEKEE